MAVYDDMLAKLPAIMRQDNVKLFYKSIAVLMDDFDELLVTYADVHLVNNATGDWLDNLGKLVGVVRDGESDEDYRANIKISYYRKYFVPTLDNLLDFIAGFTGYYPKITETQNEDISLEKGYINFTFGVPTVWGDYSSNVWGDYSEYLWRQFGYIFSPGFNFDILDQIGDIAGAGINVEMYGSSETNNEYTQSDILDLTFTYDNYTQSDILDLTFTLQS